MPSDHADATASLGPKLPFGLGRFTLCRELGAGGMATVYLSKMRLAAGMDRLVALKTIHGHLAKEKTFVDMFLDEAKIASHISHPNVCSVYDFGDVDGIFYLAMEYLVGESMFDFVNAIAEDDGEELRQALPYLAARVVADAAEGLHAAHTLRGSDGNPLNVVHRDVSPQNLFVTYEGAVKVVDFGCAKALERVTQTNTGIMKGKVSYAAPEQLKQDDGVDQRADVWALGVCLWEALTLSQLFRRDNAIKTAMAVLEEEIPRADDGNEWVPEKLADIADKALQRDPEKRYQTAREMGKALRSFIARSGVPFESAEVAEWMRYLFAERHARQRSLLSNVERMEVSKVGPVAQLGGAAEPSRDDGDDEPAIADAQTKLAKQVSARASKQKIDFPESDDEPVVLPTRTGRYVWTVLVLLLLGAGGAYAYNQYRGPIHQTLGIAQDDGDAVEGTASGDTAIGAASIGASATGDPATGDPATGDPVTGDEVGAARQSGDEAAGDQTASDEAAGDEATGETAGDETASDATGDDATDEAETAAAGDRASATSEAQRAAASRGSNRSSGRRGASETQQAAASASQPVQQQAAPSQASDDEPVRPTARLDFSQGPVSVRTRGGTAIVSLGGRQLGRTPLRVDLPVGRQTLRLVPVDGGSVRTVHVEVEWGSVTSVDVDLRPAESFGNPYQ